MGDPAPGSFAPPKPTRGQLSSTDKMLRNMAAEVAELPVGTMQRLLPVLHEARKELRTGLLHWLENAPDGAERFTAQQRRVALLNLETAIGKIRELHPEMLNTLSIGGAAAGELSVKHLRTEVARMSTVFGESLYAAPQIRAAEVLTSAQKILIPRYRNSANRYAGKVLTDIQRQLGVGVSMGETYHQLKQRLIRLGGPKGLVSLRGTLGEPGAVAEQISEGLFKRYKHWAERVVRTEMSNAYNEHHAQGVHHLNEELGDDGDDGDEYLLRWDARNDGQCYICQRLDRTAVKEGEQFAPGIFRPPAHPNCLCRCGAWRKDWGDIEGEVALKGPPPGPDAKNWPGKPGDKAEPPPKPKPAPAPPAPEIRPAEPAPPPPRPAKEPKVNTPAIPARAPARAPAGDNPRVPSGNVLEFNNQMAAAKIGGKGQGEWPELSAARKTMEQEMSSLGMVRNAERKAGAQSSLVEIPSGRAARGKWEGLHGTRNGVIQLKTKAARSAKAYAKAAAKDPRKAAKLVADGRAKLDEYLARQKAMRELERQVMAQRRLMAVSRAKLGVDSAEYIEIARKGEDLMETARDADRKLRHFGAEVLKSPEYKAYQNADGVHTMIHEVAHGYGPINRSGMHRHGLLIEEVTTEVIARSEMVRIYGIDPEVYMRGGGYAGWVDGMTEAMAKLYGVDAKAARELLADTSARFKGARTTVDSADAAADLFVDLMPQKMGQSLTDYERKTFRAEIAAISRRAP